MFSSEHRRLSDFKAHFTENRQESSRFQAPACAACPCRRQTGRQTGGVNLQSSIVNLQSIHPSPGDGEFDLSITFLMSRSNILISFVSLEIVSIFKMASIIAANKDNAVTNVTNNSRLNIFTPPFSF